MGCRRDIFLSRMLGFLILVWGGRGSFKRSQKCSEATE